MKRMNSADMRNVNGGAYWVSYTERCPNCGKKITAKATYYLFFMKNFYKVQVRNKVQKHMWNCLGF